MIYIHLDSRAIGHSYSLDHSMEPCAHSHLWERQQKIALSKRQAANMWDRMWIKLHYLAGRYYDLGCCDPAIEESIKDRLPAKIYSGTAVVLYDSDYDSDTFKEEDHKLDEEDLMEYWARKEYCQSDVEYWAKRQGGPPLTKRKVCEIRVVESGDESSDADDESTDSEVDVGGRPVKVPKVNGGVVESDD